MELTKAWESMLKQVDWSDIVEDAGGRENPNTYRDLFRTIMPLYIEELLEQGEYRKDIKIEFGEQ